MKIFHCADLHLDSKMESNLSREKAAQRQTELVDTFADMVRRAAETQASVILIAGDLFDTKKTKQKNIKNRVLYIIQQYPDTDFLYLRGNHDDEDYFSDAENAAPNLKFFNKNEWTSYTYEGVCITGRELPPSVPDGIYSELVLDKSKINIVMLHGQISKATNKADAPLINLRKLENKFIDYLALGHIHAYSQGKLDARGIYCYAGCLEGRGFDETGDKGYVEIDIEKGILKSVFVPIARRNLVELNIDISGETDFVSILNKIKKACDGIPAKDLLKVVLTGEVTEDADIDIELFSEQLKNEFFFIKIEDKTQRKIEYEKYRNEISLKGEFVRTVEAEDIDENEKAEIIITGLKALAGKELR